jgi:starvation-inducible DNA-binding protein
MTAQLDHRLETDELQCELRDLLCLAVLGDHVRWVLAGADTAQLGDWLADATPRWRALADRVAERLAALGVPPDGRVRSLAKDISMNWVPAGWLSSDEARRLVGHRLHSAAGRARYRCSQACDSATMELLDTVCAGLEHRP